MAAEQWCCSDQITHQQSANSTLDSNNPGSSGSQRSVVARSPEAARWELTRSSGGKCRQKTALPADLFDPTMNREGASYSEGQRRNRVYLTEQTLSSATWGAILCSGARCVNLSGWLGAGMFLIQYTELIPWGKQCQLHILQSLCGPGSDGQQLRIFICAQTGTILHRGKG